MSGPAGDAGPEMPSDIHPDRLLACFSTVSSPVVLEHLQNEPRFAGRLTEIVTAHYGLSARGNDIDPADRVLADFSTEELDAIALRAGVVLNGRVFLREIRGPMLAALGERFGAQALEDARHHADLAADRMPVGDLDVLERAVYTDGQACLGAWIAALPSPVADQVKLKWPDDASVPAASDEGLGERGPQILRRLVPGVEGET
jgi:hypothetical protein